MTAKTTTYPQLKAYKLWSGLEAEFDRYHLAVSFIPMDYIKVQENLRRYLCLRCAGFLEKLVFECLTDYLSEKASGPAVHFATSHFKQAPNLNARTFRKLMERFGPDHAERFDSFLTSALRDSLNDLHAVRNPIAHGSLTGGRKLDPERYRRLCKATYDWLTADLLRPTIVAVEV